MIEVVFRLQRRNGGPKTNSRSQVLQPSHYSPFSRHAHNSDF